VVTTQTPPPPPPPRESNYNHQYFFKLVCICNRILLESPLSPFCEREWSLLYLTRFDFFSGFSLPRLICVENLASFPLLTFARLRSSLSARHRLSIHCSNDLPLRPDPMSPFLLVSGGRLVTVLGRFRCHPPRHITRLPPFSSHATRC